MAWMPPRKKRLNNGQPRHNADLKGWLWKDGCGKGLSKKDSPFFIPKIEKT